MIDLSYKEKVQRLRDKFKDDPENMEVILEWEKRLKGISDVDDFMALEATKAIVSSLKARLVAIYRDKAVRTEWTPEDLKLANERIKEIQHIMGLFAPSFEDELNHLSQEMDRALEL